MIPPPPPMPLGAHGRSRSARRASLRARLGGVVGTGCCAACRELGGAHQPATVAASALIAAWERARSASSPADRLVWLDLVLLTGIAGGVATCAELFLSRLSPAGRRRAERTACQVVAECEAACGTSVRALHDAWDDGASCPLGVALPPLSPIRSDLPLRREYRALPPRARLVLLSLAGEVGHRSVLADAGVLSRRSGLPVDGVQESLCVLTEGRWLRREPETAVVVRPTPALFLPLWAGPWAARTSRSRLVGPS